MSLAKFINLGLCSFLLLGCLTLASCSNNPEEAPTSSGANPTSSVDVKHETDLEDDDILDSSSVESSSSKADSSKSGSSKADSSKSSSSKANSSKPTSSKANSSKPASSSNSTSSSSSSRNGVTVHPNGDVETPIIPIK